MGTQTYWAKDPETAKKKRVPSVTSILKWVGDKSALHYWHWEQGKLAAEMEADGAGPFRSVWDLPRGAAEIGTIVHAMIEADVTGRKFARDMYQPFPAEADASFAVWKRWKERRGFELVASELSLTSWQWQYGGTMDAVARVDGALTLIDFKTGKAIYADAILQLAAYAALWAEHRPDDKLDSLMILRLSKTDGSLHHHEWPTSSPSLAQAWRGFVAALNVYDVLARHLKDAA